MTDTHTLIHSLKRGLRSSGLTYADVAKELELSEASVKRLFSEKNMSLQRLEAICGMLGWDFSDLSNHALHHQQQIDQLSLEQEQEIAADLLLLIVTVSVINGFSFRDLIEHYAIDEHECVQKLATLDRLNLIELQPGNRIKRRIAQNFRWDPHGPIQAFFTEKVVDDFFNSRFTEQHEKLVVLNGLLSTKSNAELQQKLEVISAHFDDLRKQDAPLSMNEKAGHTLILALRQWRFPVFDKHLRQK